MKQPLSQTFSFQRVVSRIGCVFGLHDLVIEFTIPNCGIIRGRQLSCVSCVKCGGKWATHNAGKSRIKWSTIYSAEDEACMKMMNEKNGTA